VSDSSVETRRRYLNAADQKSKFEFWISSSRQKLAWRTYATESEGVAALLRRRTKGSTMQLSSRKIGWLPVLLPAIFALSLAGSPAKADRATTIAHSALRGQIASDAHDRYGIRFTTTSVQRYTRYGQEIVGRGSFYRHGKSMQWFKYHVFVNPRDGSVSDIGYKIHK